MPTLSFEVCAHNEVKNIGALLNALLEGQHPDPEYRLEEVVVVSYGSTDGNAEIVRRNRDPMVKLIVEGEREGKSHAQLILSRAKGNIIDIISANIVPSRDAIIRLARDRNYQMGGASGRTTSLNKSNGPANFASRSICKPHNLTNKRLDWIHNRENGNARRGRLNRVENRFLTLA